MPYPQSVACGGSGDTLWQAYTPSKPQCQAYAFREEVVFIANICISRLHMHVKLIYTL